MSESLTLRRRDGASDPSRTHRRAFGLYKKNNDDDEPFSLPTSFNVTIAALPSLSACLKSFFGMTVVLYILNQKHLLPKPIGRVVSKALFWPTLPITVSRRIGSWSTVVDETVIMGGAPFGFVNMPEYLHDEYGVTGVINMCEEYAGPVRKYSTLGIHELWLPTVDHFEPSVQDLKSAVSFIQTHAKRGDRVYVHCRAGHGRSAAAVFAWLIFRNPDVDPQVLNNELCQIRNVRKTLWRQPNIKEYHSLLKRRGETRKNGLSQQLMEWKHHDETSSDDEEQ
jgi:atypical dual specificity phosphatase